MKYLKPWDETIRALGFLTRIPIADRFYDERSGQQADRTPGFYPLAGLVIGLMSSAVFALAYFTGFSTFIAATLTIIFTIALTGALHEDGLADVADGFGGGMTTERRLEIMKDSRLGTYGVVAVIASLLLRIGCIVAIAEKGGMLSACLAILASATLSRGAMVWFWASLPAARAEGVSARYGSPSETAVSTAAILGLTLGMLLALLAAGIVSAGMGLGFSLLAMYGLQRACMQMIGGQTGDTLGACQQLVEITFLLGLATAL